MKPLRPMRFRPTPDHSAAVSRPGGMVSHLACMALLCVVATCASASIAPASARRAATERLITPADFGGAVSVRHGDVLRVLPPMTADEWQVTYDKTFLEFQGALETIAHPESHGWTFHVLRAGETSLTVTPVIRRGPNPPRFTLGLHIDA
jgi:hypothetical protein